jgi:hypothetical protein
MNKGFFFALVLKLVLPLAASAQAGRPMGLVDMLEVPELGDPRF